MFLDWWQKVDNHNWLPSGMKNILSVKAQERSAQSRLSTKHCAPKADFPTRAPSAEGPFFQSKQTSWDFIPTRLFYLPFFFFFFSDKRKFNKFLLKLITNLRRAGLFLKRQKYKTATKNSRQFISNYQLFLGRNKKESKNYSNNSKKGTSTFVIFDVLMTKCLRFQIPLNFKIKKKSILLAIVSIKSA